MQLRAMSEADVELMRQGLQAFEREGVEGLVRFIHPDFEMTTPAGLAAEPDTYRGHDGMRRYFDSFYDVMDDIRFEQQGFEDLGERRVLVISTLKARGQSTGIEVEQQVALVWELQDGLAYRCHVFGDPNEARAAFAT
jgi:ketosteroid isomerase-like protein